MTVRMRHHIDGCMCALTFLCNFLTQHLSLPHSFIGRCLEGTNMSFSGADSGVVFDVGAEFFGLQLVEIARLGFDLDKQRLDELDGRFG